MPDYVEKLEVERDFYLREAKFFSDQLDALRAAQQGAEAVVTGCGYAPLTARPYLTVQGDGRIETFGPGDKVRVTKVEP